MTSSPAPQFHPLNSTPPETSNGGVISSSIVVDLNEEPEKGRIQLERHPSLSLLKKVPTWSETRPQETAFENAYGAQKELSLCENVMSCFFRSQNYYVKVEILETRFSHTTEPVCITPQEMSLSKRRTKTDFQLDERYNNVLKCGLDTKASPQGLTFRAAIYDEVIGTDKLVGYGQTSLDSLTEMHKRLTLPLNIVNKPKKVKKRRSKKGKRKKRWRRCERPKESAKTLYLSLPTHNDDRYTGELFFKFDYNRLLIYDTYENSDSDADSEDEYDDVDADESPFFKVTVLGGVDVCPKYDWDDYTEDSGFGFKEVGITLYLVFHIAACAWIMQYLEGDNDPNCARFAHFDQSLWFVMVTFASVGYGDMYPCTDAGRVANGIMILTYQLTIAWFFSIAAQLFLMQGFMSDSKSEAFRQYVDRIWQCVYKDVKARFEIGDKVLTRDERCDLRTAIVQDVIKDYDEVEKDWDVRYQLIWLTDPSKKPFYKIEEQIRKISPLTLDKLWYKLLSTLAKTGALVLLMVLCGTLVFKALESEAFEENNDFPLTFANTFHFSLVTMSTVGYGDWAPYTASGRAFGAFFILCGVTLLANFAGIVVGYFLQREELLNSQEFLNNSLVTPEQILDFDMDGDGEISKYEYLVKSLLQCQFVREDKIDLIMAKFHDIDTDKSGQISLDDFVNYAHNSVSDKEDESESDHVTLLPGDVAGEQPVE